LHRQIQNWREVQLIYTPQVSYLLSQTEQPPETDVNMALSPSEIIPENIALYLPSSLPHHLRSLPALREICLLEKRLREPQADDALSDVRRQRRVIQGLWQFKKLNISGTGNKPNTRLINLYKQFDKKTKRFAEKYRTAWQALRSLDPNGSWAIRLKELKDSDIRGPGKDVNEVTTSSRYELSWIWLVQRSIEAGICEEEEVSESMRAEWAKTRARMSRWKEELLLVQEEMRRVLFYHKWKALWWRTRSSMRVMDDMTILSGVSGYAHKQATIWERMANQCACYWLPELKIRGIAPSWEADYVDIANNPSVQQVRGDLEEDIEADQERLDLNDKDDDDDDDDDEGNRKIREDEGDYSDLDLDDD